MVGGRVGHAWTRAVEASLDEIAAEAERRARARRHAPSSESGDENQ
jgi:hypothetical protein